MCRILHAPPSIHERETVVLGWGTWQHPAGSYRWPSATCDLTVIVSDPVQISQIRYGKSIISQTLIVSDPVARLK